MDAITKRFMKVVDYKHQASIADAAARAMAEHCDTRIAEKDAEVENLRALLNRALGVIESAADFYEGQGLRNRAKDVLHLAERINAALDHSAPEKS